MAVLGCQVGFHSLQKKKREEEKKNRAFLEQSVQYKEIVQLSVTSLELKLYIKGPMCKGREKQHEMDQNHAAWNILDKPAIINNAVSRSAICKLNVVTPDVRIQAGVQMCTLCRLLQA